MKKRNLKLVYWLIICLALLSFNCTTTTDKKESTQSDSLKTFAASTVQTIVENTKVNVAVDELAKYIAGIKRGKYETIDSTLIANDNWKTYSEEMNKSWTKLDTTKFKKMRNWRDEELKQVNTKTIFYPFSGADFLNVFTFFPSAETYVMVGLEPVGSLPKFAKNNSKDTISSYFYKVNQSLYAVLNFSFFRTNSMKVDFKNKDLNGTIHLIALFLERTGNSIVSLKSFAVNDNGIGVTSDSLKENTTGVEIKFINASKELKTVIYLSVNLDNNHLKKNVAFTKYIEQCSRFTTYIKSASYLMYEEYFSTVRKLILDNSNFILQDDSGIPYRYFDDKTWNTQLYGTYMGAIPLFHNVMQNDLKTAFDSSGRTKPLPFGIGYKYKPGTSNLMLSAKINKK